MKTTYAETNLVAVEREVQSPKPLDVDRGWNVNLFVGVGLALALALALARKEIEFRVVVNRRLGVDGRVVLRQVRARLAVAV